MTERQRDEGGKKTKSLVEFCIAMQIGLAMHRNAKVFINVRSPARIMSLLRVLSLVFRHDTYNSNRLDINAHNLLGFLIIQTIAYTDKEKTESVYLF